MVHHQVHSTIQTPVDRNRVYYYNATGITRNESEKQSFINTLHEIICLIDLGKLNNLVIWELLQIKENQGYVTFQSGYVYNIVRGDMIILVHSYFYEADLITNALRFYKEIGQTFSAVNLIIIQFTPRFGRQPFTISFFYFKPRSSSVDKQMITLKKRDFPFEQVLNLLKTLVMRDGRHLFIADFNLNEEDIDKTNLTLRNIFRSRFVNSVLKSTIEMLLKIASLMWLET